MKIQDEFTSRNVSKQRKYQLRKRREGKCVICGKPAFMKSKKFCLDHAEKRRLLSPKNGSCRETEFLNYLKVPLRQVMVENTLVDGILDGVIYEFLGNYWHGNPKVFAPDTINKRAGISFGELYKLSFEKLDKLTEHGYKVKYIWEYDWQQFKIGKVSSPNIQEHTHA